jgi:hypothetical protein
MQDTPTGTPRRRPSWPRRHPVITTLATVFTALSALVVVAGVVLGTAVNQAAKPNSVTGTQAAATSQAASPAAALTPAGTPTLSLGQTADINQDGQDAARITITRVSVTSQPADQYGEAPQNGYFVIAHIRARTLNSYSQGFDVNPFDFYAKAGRQHFEYDNGNAFGALGMNQNTMDAATLNGGESTSGLIVFDLPRPHGLIAYSPNFEGGPLAYWRF